MHPPNPPHREHPPTANSNRELYHASLVVCAYNYLLTQLPSNHHDLIMHKYLHTYVIPTLTTRIKSPGGSDSSSNGSASPDN